MTKRHIGHRLSGYGDLAIFGIVILCITAFFSLIIGVTVVYSNDIWCPETELYREYGMHNDERDLLINEHNSILRLFTETHNEYVLAKEEGLKEREVELERILNILHARYLELVEQIGHFVKDRRGI